MTDSVIVASCATVAEKARVDWIGAPHLKMRDGDADLKLLVRNLEANIVRWDVNGEECDARQTRPSYKLFAKSEAPAIIILAAEVCSEVQ